MIHAVKAVIALNYITNAGNTNLHFGNILFHFNKVFKIKLVKTI